ncbi:MAG: thymidine phosphorylase [Geminicoccales bacterium]
MTDKIAPLPQEIIKKKRDGEALDAGDIESLIAGLTDGNVTEGQVAAFAMAVFFNGMNRDETIALTLAMRNSGKTLSWQHLDGPVLDKHSTGGIGDKVSLILAPIIAAVGGYVPMISGRGLGHTGGTLDKLDSIPGYETRPGLDAFRQAVQSTGCAIVGQTADLAPADGTLYAIRDITATVDIRPLIVASILSKKLAAGLEGLVMDVKVGSGAFMPTIAAAKTLAEDLVAVAKGAGLTCRARLTDMNQCLGTTAGNALEVREAIDFLTGRRRAARLKTVTLALASDLIEQSRLAAGSNDARKMAEGVLDDGRAAICFQRMVAALGGPADLLDKPEYYFPTASVERAVFLPRSGYIAEIDARELGLAIIGLGGGRRRPNDKIDHRVGLSDLLNLGDEVSEQRPVALIHAANDDDADQATGQIQKAIKVTDSPPVTIPPSLYEQLS